MPAVMKTLLTARGHAMNKINMLIERTRDKRSRQVVFLSHCILNENTRYLGGACRPACVSEILDLCVKNNLGIVQMLCPEQKAWGGVLKRFLLTAYGIEGSFLYTSRNLLMPLMLFYTKLIYRRMAGETIRQIIDYSDSGFDVHGIIGIDGSPTCGVNRTLDFMEAFEGLAHLKPDTITTSNANQVVRECLKDGKGLFIEVLQEKLRNRKVDLRFWGHDLIEELDGNSSNVIF